MTREPDKQHRRGELHVEGDQMPYVWPRGPLTGPVTAKRVWQAISVLLVFVLVAVIAYAASKSR